MKYYKSAMIVLLVFIIQSLIHYWIASYYELAQPLFFKMYGFLAFITLLVILIVEFTQQNFKEQLGFVFLAIIVFKFLAALFFMQLTELDQSSAKYHFLIAYLILIFIFTLYVASKLLNTDKKHLDY